MNRIIKVILVSCLVLTAALLGTGCAQEQDPYQLNDAQGYSVSVKYDANGGIFTTNTAVIMDSYSISDLEAAGSGGQIALIPPDHEARGNDAFAAVNNGYFLAGWYTERNPSVDEAGNTVYTYSGRWDFEKDRLSVDPNGTYTAQTPALTLYAAWVPLFQVEFYDLETGEYLDSYSFDPAEGQELTVPAWDQQTGCIEMYDFPERSGSTFAGAYYDGNGTESVNTAAVVHTGVVDYETGTARDHVMKLYIRWMEGEWYHIYNVEQFKDNASVSGNYILHEDLDFSDEIWPTSLMYGNFSGTIQGNGHTVSNVTVTQTNNSKVNAGLFGNLTDRTALSDVTFENVTFTIEAGTRVAGTSYGLLAGVISDQAQLSNVQIVDSRLLIDAAAYFGTDDYVIGLVCGMGRTDIDAGGISCQTVGEGLYVSVADGVVTLQDQPLAEDPADETQE